MQSRPAGTRSRAGASMPPDVGAVPGFDNPFAGYKSRPQRRLAIAPGASIAFALPGRRSTLRIAWPQEGRRSADCCRGGDPYDVGAAPRVPEGAMDARRLNPYTAVFAQHLFRTYPDWERFAQVDDHGSFLITVPAPPESGMTEPLWIETVG